MLAHIILMISRSVKSDSNKQEFCSGDEVLSVKNLTRYGFFHDVSFSLMRGEVLGVYGLSGSGRTELACGIVGYDKIDHGEIFLNNKKIKIRNICKAISHGIAYLTENRKLTGLSLRLSVYENLISAILPRMAKFGIFNKKRGGNIFSDLMSQLAIYPNDPNKVISNLSGGNQQKVLLAKWLATNPDILILDEPSRGVDIGAKMLIHETIDHLAANKTSIIVISSDLPEIVRLCNRVIIMKDGYLIKEIFGPEIFEDLLLLAANGEY